MARLHHRITLHLELTRTPAPLPTGNALRLATLFGLSTRPQPQRLIPPTTLTLRPGQITFITGPSGAGKSTLLKLIHTALQQRPVRLASLDHLPPAPDRPLVDCFGRLPLARVTGLLARAGLGEARTLLLTPAQLSSGQLWRFQLARALARLSPRRRPHRLRVLLTDEFAAGLDALTAAVLARNVRRWTRHHRIAAVLATSRTELLEPLEPEVLVYKGLGQALIARQRGGERITADQPAAPEPAAHTLGNASAGPLAVLASTHHPVWEGAA